MAKDPAFLFYTSDFLTGTLTMTDEQVGKYIRLLCLQHQKGELTEKDMLFICKSHDEDIFSKFKNIDGKYYNERLREESIKRIKYSESRRNNKLKKNISSTYVQHMENENENNKYSINVLLCKEIAIKDLQWMERNNPTEKEFKEFIDLLTDRGDTVKTPKDFKSHFSNWKKGKKEEKSEPIKHLSL